MADKKSNQKAKQHQKPAQQPVTTLHDPAMDDMEIKKGRPSLVDPNPEVDPGDDEGTLSSQQKVPGGIQTPQQQ